MDTALNALPKKTGALMRFSKTTENCASR